ncbi:G5 domain-containing protein [Parvimonas sp. G1967]|uniref:G5 domain-containing protein n=1 Tax=Parvimonas sp. G1967 TaxID=3387695 RepID=UPI0039E652A3
MKSNKKRTKKNKLIKSSVLFLASLSILTACGKPKVEKEQPNQNNANNQNEKQKEEKGKGSKEVEQKNEQKNEQKVVKREVTKRTSNQPKVSTKRVVNRNLGTKKLSNEKSNQEALKRQRDLLVAREKEEERKKLLAEKQRKEELAREEARKAEEARKKAEEARKKAEEEKKKAEAAKKKAEEEAEKKKAEEAKKKAEEEAKKKAEEEKKLAEELKKAKIIATETVNKLNNIDKAKYIERINNANSVKELDEIVASAIKESDENTSVIDEEEKKKLAELKAYREKAIKVINELKNIDGEKQGFINEINVAETTENIDKIVERAEKLSEQKTKEIEEAITEIIEEVVETITTPMQTIETTSDELEEGKEQVTEGQDGITEVTYKITYNVSKKNGKVLVSKEKIKEEVKQQMKKRIVVKGTKKVDNTKYVNSSELKKLIDDCDSTVMRVVNSNLMFENNKEVVKAQALYDTIRDNASVLANSKEKLTETEFLEAKTKLMGATNNLVKTYEKVVKEANERDKDVTVRVSDTENTVIKGHYEDKEALKHIELLNKYRNYEKDLEIDEDLMRIAKIRAAEITQLFEHTRVDGKSLDTLRELLGENIAMTSEDVGAEETLDQFKKSKAHNRNMLKSAYTKVGVAIFKLRVEDGDGNFHYETYTVQVFLAE